MNHSWSACRFGTLLLLSFSLPFIAAPAHAERGAIEGDVHASVGSLHHAPGPFAVGVPRLGVSIGYRIEPHVALGLRLDEAFADTGADYYNGVPVFKKGTFLQAYVDGRLYPDSNIDFYSRLSLGGGDTFRLNVDKQENFHLRGIIDIEAGPELRIFFTGKRPHRPVFFARAHVGATLIGTQDSFFNWGFTLGFSG